MNENYLEKISEILEVSAESIEALPEKTKENMQAVFETLPAENEENKNEIYSALDELWQKGTVLSTLEEIAHNTGLSPVTLENLDDETQKELVYEFLMDSSQNERFFEIVNKALAVMELTKISELLSVPVGRLKKLPIEIQEKMCGIYSMEYEPDGTNAGLLDQLREIELMSNE